MLIKKDANKNQVELWKRALSPVCMQHIQSKRKMCECVSVESASRWIRFGFY